MTWRRFGVAHGRFDRSCPLPQGEVEPVERRLAHWWEDYIRDRPEVRTRDYDATITLFYEREGWDPDVISKVTEAMVERVTGWKVRKRRYLVGLIHHHERVLAAPSAQRGEAVTGGERPAALE